METCIKSSSENVVVANKTMILQNLAVKIFVAFDFVFGGGSKICESGCKYGALGWQVNELEIWKDLKCI